MRIERRYTEKSKSAYAAIEFRTTKSEIRNPDGSVVFRLEGIEVPASWSQVAADILAQKYFRKAGVLARLERQMSLEKKKEFADYIIDTSGAKADALRQTEMVYRELRRLHP